MKIRSNNKTISWLWLASCAAVFLACGATPPPYVPPPAAVVPVRNTVPPSPEPELPAREAPPPSGPAHAIRFPTVFSSELPNGLGLAVIQNRSVPLVHIRVAVLSGSAFDGEKPGLSALTAKMVQESGAGGLGSAKTFERIESLGASLKVNTDLEYTSFGLSVVKDALNEAMELLSAIVLKSPLSQGQFERIKKQSIENAQANAKEDTRWMAEMVMWNDLFALPTDRHPYASFDAISEEIEKITASDCRSFYYRHYVPKNMLIAVSGDTTPELVRAAAEKTFGAQRGGERPILSYTDPMPQEGRKITVVDRPNSTQSSVMIGYLAPRWNDASFAAALVGSEVIGQAFVGRIYLDLREKQGLVYLSGAHINELAKSPSVLIALADTETNKTGLAVEGLLNHLGQLSKEEPAQAEVDAAARNIVGLSGIELDVAGRTASLLIQMRANGVPDELWGGVSKDVLAVTPAQVLKAASESLRPGHEVIVAAGDANVIGPMLSHFGEVKVVDPTQHFRRLRTIAANAEAPLSVPSKAPEAKP